MWCCVISNEKWVVSSHDYLLVNENGCVFQNEIAKTPKSNQSQNTSRKHKSEKQMGQHGPPDTPQAGPGAQEEQTSPANWPHPPRSQPHDNDCGATHRQSQHVKHCPTTGTKNARQHTAQRKLATINQTTATATTPAKRRHETKLQKSLQHQPPASSHLDPKTDRM
jgi:hypothetical protein